MATDREVRPSLLSAFQMRTFARQCDVLRARTNGRYDADGSWSQWLRGLSDELSKTAASELASRYPAYAQLDIDEAVTRFGARNPDVVDPRGVIDRYLDEYTARYGEQPGGWQLDTTALDEIETGHGEYLFDYASADDDPGAHAEADDGAAH